MYACGIITFRVIWHNNIVILLRLETKSNTEKKTPGKAKHNFFKHIVVSSLFEHL